MVVFVSLRKCVKKKKYVYIHIITINEVRGYGFERAHGGVYKAGWREERGRERINDEIISKKYKK